MVAQFSLSILLAAMQAATVISWKLLDPVQKQKQNCVRKSSHKSQNREPDEGTDEKQTASIVYFTYCGYVWIVVKQDATKYWGCDAMRLHIENRDKSWLFL